MPLRKSPLAGWHVYASSSCGTITAADGSFALKADCLSRPITISHIGYNTQTIDAKHIPQPIALNPSSISVGEVPVLSLSGSRRAKRMLRRGIANYYRHVRSGWYTAIMEQHQRVSPPDAPADSLLIRALVVSANLRSMRDTITPAQGEPYFSAIGIEHSPQLDTALYTPPAHMLPRRLPLPTSHHANKLLQDYFFLMHLDPGIIWAQFFEEALPYFVLPRRTPDTIVVGVVDYGYSSDYYTLTNRQFRRKHRHQLRLWKESIDYNPSSPIYARTEQQVDSLFYAMLRHRMQHGSLRRNEARFYISSSTNAVVKVELSATHLNHYTKLRYEYSDTSLGASNALLLSRMLVRSNPRGYDITTDIRFTNHTFTRSPAHIDPRPIAVRIYD